MFRFAVGGIIPDLKIEHTLESDARNDMISKWLGGYGKSDTEVRSRKFTYPIFPFTLPTINSSAL
jgi:hypothetical protein